MPPSNGGILSIEDEHSRRIGVILIVGSALATRMEAGIGADSALEEVLIRKCRRQEPVAFAQVVDLYQHRIYGYVRRMVATAEDAEDVAQDVFVRAYQHFPTFDSRCSLRSWLFRIATNLCIDRARSSQRRKSIEGGKEEVTFEDLNLAADGFDPAEIVLTRELSDIVERAIEEMSAKLKSVLLMHDQQGMSYEEISKVLDVPIGTVKSRLFLARAHVQKAIQSYRSESSL
jgi:RNA polymerase sigma-70 factor (ECF subfamily)